MDEPRLAGSKVLVTGASRGIGRAVAEAFVHAGADVAITGRKRETLEPVAASLASSGREIKVIACHQGQSDQIAQLFDQLDRDWGRIDTAIINAATNPVLCPLIDIEQSAWDKVVEVNLTGAFLTSQAAARRMAKQQSGSIVFISSIAAFDPLPGLGAYSVTKAGIIGLAKALAKELAAAGVRVNAVAPGLIETQFSRALIDNPTLHKRLLSAIPLGRHGQPQDVVGAVLFLASPSASYITGQVLTVDGGTRV